MYLHHFSDPMIAIGMLGALGLEIKAERHSWSNEEWDDYEFGKRRVQAFYSAGDNGRHRNEPCPCDSGKKFKKCCQGKYEMSFLSDRR